MHVYEQRCSRQLVLLKLVSKGTLGNSLLEIFECEHRCV